MLEWIKAHQDLVIYIGIGLLVLIVAIVLLSIFVFKPSNLKKQLRAIDRKFQFAHGLLQGQNSQNVKRLEIISRTNLLYVDVYSKYMRRLKEIRDRNDIPCSEVINNLKDLLSDKDFKGFKDLYKEAVSKVNEYNKVINDFTNELNKVVQPEEDCRQSALTYKEQLRNVKQDYYAKEASLAIMNESFEEVFEYIDSLFKEFDEFVDSAQYDEANSVLPQISSILHELNANMKILPELCALINDVVPEKVHKIDLAYKAMMEEHYPLHHLNVLQTLNAIQKGLEGFTSRMKEFDTIGIHDGVNEMLSTLDKFIDKFEEEKKARVIFDEKNNGVYSKVNSLEHRFITLRNNISEVNEIYIINDEHKQKIDVVQKDINKLGGLKRTLDTYFHSSTKQPYSLLVSKMTEIEECNVIVEEELNEFDSYLDTLKQDAEKAYDLVYTTFDKVKKAEKLVRLMSLESVNKKYAPKFNELYNLLNSLYEVLTTSPIDIDKSNELVREVYECSNSLLDDGEIQQDYNMMVLAENAILHGNKDRNHLADIDQLLSQAEVFFADGDFENSYKISSGALSKIKQTNGKK